MSEDPKPARPQAPERSQEETHKTSGRISFDKRGNPVWEWALKTGIFGRDIDTKRLKALEAKELKIVEDPVGKADPKEKQARPPVQQPSGKPVAPIKPIRDAGGGMNPYDNTTSAKPKVVAPATAHKDSAPEPESEPRRSWWDSLKKKFSREED